MKAFRIFVYVASFSALLAARNDRTGNRKLEQIKTRRDCGEQIAKENQEFNMAQRSRKNASGGNAECANGLNYDPANPGPDGTHPPMAGKKKVASRLPDFLRNAPTSRPWFVKN